MDSMHTAMLIAFGMILVGMARLAIVGWRRPPVTSSWREAKRLAREQMIAKYGADKIPTMLSPGEVFYGGARIVKPGVSAAINPSALANVPRRLADDIATITQNLRDQGLQPDQRMDGGERPHVATPFEKAIEEIT
jgi:hypothetical protein